MKCLNCKSETERKTWKDGTIIVKCLKCSWQQREDLKAGI